MSTFFNNVLKGARPGITHSKWVQGGAQPSLLTGDRAAEIQHRAKVAGVDVMPLQGFLVHIDKAVHEAAKTGTNETIWNFPRDVVCTDLQRRIIVRRLVGNLQQRGFIVLPSKRMWSILVRWQPKHNPEVLGKKTVTRPGPQQDVGPVRQGLHSRAAASAVGAVNVPRPSFRRSRFI